MDKKELFKRKKWKKLTTSLIVHLVQDDPKISSAADILQDKKASGSPICKIANFLESTKSSSNRTRQFVLRFVSCRENEITELIQKEKVKRDQERQTGLNADQIEEKNVVKSLEPLLIEFQGERKEVQDTVVKLPESFTGESTGRILIPEDDKSKSEKKSITDLKPCELGIRVPQNYCEFHEMRLKMDNACLEAGLAIAQKKNLKICDENQYRLLGITHWSQKLDRVLNFLFIFADRVNLNKSNMQCEKRCVLTVYLRGLLELQIFMLPLEELKQRFQDYSDETENLDFIIHVLNDGYSVKELLGSTAFFDWSSAFLKICEEAYYNNIDTNMVKKHHTENSAMNIEGAAFPKSSQEPNNLYESTPMGKAAASAPLLNPAHQTGITLEGRSADELNEIDCISHLISQEEQLKIIDDRIASPRIGETSRQSDCEEVMSVSSDDQEEVGKSQKEQLKIIDERIASPRIGETSRLSDCEEVMSVSSDDQEEVGKSQKEQLKIIDERIASPRIGETSRLSDCEEVMSVSSDEQEEVGKSQEEQLKIIDEQRIASPRIVETSRQSECEEVMSVSADEPEEVDINTQAILSSIEDNVTNKELLISRCTVPCSLQLKLPQNLEDFGALYNNLLKWSKDLGQEVISKNFEFAGLNTFEYIFESKFYACRHNLTSQSDLECSEKCILTYWLIEAVTFTVFLYGDFEQSKMKFMNFPENSKFFLTEFLEVGFSKMNKLKFQGNPDEFLNWKKNFIEKATKATQEDLNLEELYDDIAINRFQSTEHLPTKPRKDKQTDLNKNDNSNFVKQHRPTVFSDCTIKIGKILFSTSEWERMLNKDKTDLDGKVYPEIIITRMATTLGIGCVLVVRSKQYYKRDRFMDIKFMCKHEMCRKFIVRLKNAPKKHVDLELVVYTNTLKTNHGEYPLSRPCRGIAREELKEDLQHNSALNVANDRVVESDKTIVRKGYAIKMYSDDVYRKVKNEGTKAAAMSLDKDDFCSVKLKLEKEVVEEEENQIPRFIRTLSTPLCCVLYYHSQLLMLSECKDKLGYLDATGTVCRKMTKCPVFYYSIVFLVNSKTVPALEFFLENHDHASISVPLIKFVYEWTYKLNLRQPIFTNIVTDFSWAMIKAVLFSFTRMDVIQYLKYCYACDTGKRKMNNRLTHLNLCCAHVMKILCDLASTKFNNITAKRTAKEVAAKIIDTRSLREAEAIMKNFYTILQSKRKDDAYNNAMKELLKTTCTDFEEFEKTQISDLDEEVETVYIYEASKTLYKQSPYFGRFSDLMEQCKDLVGDPQNTDHEVNELFSPSFAKDLTSRYLSYLPMINSSMVPKEKKRLSNAPVEGWNKIRKKQIMEGRPNLSLDTNVELSRKYAKSMIARHEFKIRSKQATKILNPTLHFNDVEEDTTLPESWQAKPAKVDGSKNKKKSTYFGGKTLKKLQADKTNCENSITKENDQHSNVSQVMRVSQQEEIDSHHFDDCDAKSDGDIEEQPDIECDILSRDHDERFIEDKKSEGVSDEEIEEVNDLHVRRKHSMRKTIGMPMEQALHENDLSKNTHFYCKLEELHDNYTVCIFDPKENIRLTQNERDKVELEYVTMNKNEKKRVSCCRLSKPNHILELNDLLELLDPNATLKSTVLETFLKVLLQKYEKTEEILLVPNISSWKFVNAIDKYSKVTKAMNCAIQNIPELYKCAFFPILEQSHYVLYVVDFNTYEVKIYNSMDNHIKMTRLVEIWNRIKINFFKQLELMKMNDTTHNFDIYEIKIIKCPQQKDAVSCGFGVAYFSEQLMTDQEISLQQDVAGYRWRFVDILFKESLAVSNLCLVCNKNDLQAQNRKWVQCGYCERWYHTSCIIKTLKLNVKTIEEEEMRCALCRHFLRHSTVEKPPT